MTIIETSQRDSQAVTKVVRVRQHHDSGAMSNCASCFEQAFIIKRKSLPFDSLDDVEQFSPTYWTCCTIHILPDTKAPTLTTMAANSSSVSSILEDISSAGKGLETNEAGSREALIERSRALIATLEITSEFIQNKFWSEVSLMNNRKTVS